MWNVQDFDAVPVKLDFSSSGQGYCSATAIETAGVRLFNAIELIDVDAMATQVEVCESCGIPHCSSGGWVAFRRIGDCVAWIPAWDRMEENAWAETSTDLLTFWRSKEHQYLVRRPGNGFGKFMTVFHLARTCRA
jgi:hypothetical protein